MDFSPKMLAMYFKYCAPGLVLVPLVVGLVVGWWLASGTYRPEFFRTTAEVIPVLLLVDMKSLSIDISPITGPKAKGLLDAIVRATEFQLNARVFAAGAIGVLVVVTGEIISLLVVGGDGEPSGKWEQGFVLGACFTGLAMVAVRGISVKRRPTEGSHSGDTETR
jgi:hypothetical protein